MEREFIEKAIETIGRFEYLTQQERKVLLYYTTRIIRQSEATDANRRVSIHRGTKDGTYNNGKKTIRLKPNDDIPWGFTRGCLPYGEKQSRCHWWTNGVKDVQVPVGRPGPEGFVRGRTWIQKWNAKRSQNLRT